MTEKIGVLKEKIISKIKSFNSETIKRGFSKVVDFFKKIRKNKWVANIIDIGGTVILFAIAAGAGIFVAVGQHAGNAEKYAQRYFEAYITQNWPGMYEMLDIEESEYVNQEAFERMIEAKAIYGEFSGAEVEITKKSGNNAYVDITYEDDNGDKAILSLKMKKQKEKVYKFFSTWKVDGESLVVKNCKINVPSGTTATLDSKELDDKLINSQDGRDLYVVNRMFTGEHDFGISTVYIDAYIDTFYVEEDGFEYHVNQQDFELKDEDEEYLEDATAKLVFGMYNNALNEEGTESLKTYFGSGKDNLDLLESCYKAMEADISQEDGAMLISMDIASYSTYVFNYSYPDKVEMRVDFNCSYKAKTGRSVASGVRGTYENTAISTCKLIFGLSDEGWVVDEMDVKCIKYEPPEGYFDRD